MLVLSRKPGETIRVDGPCIITLVRVGPNSARIGVKAAPDVAIVRDDAHPPVLEAFDALAKAADGRWDGIDAEAYVAALRAD